MGSMVMLIKHKLLAGLVVSACYCYAQQGIGGNTGGTSITGAPGTWPSYLGVSGLSSPSIGTTPITESFIAGTGGTIANTLVKTDASFNVVTTLTSDTGAYGIAMSTVSATAGVQVARLGVALCFADNATTIGHLVIIGTGTAGYCRDSAQTSSSAVSNATRIIGVFKTAVSGGALASVELMPSHFGTQTGWTDNGTTVSALSGRNVQIGTSALDPVLGITAPNLSPTASTWAAVAAAYAALPASGGTILITQDVTISSAQVLTITNGKGLTLDLQGHAINCTVTSGICLQVKYTTIGGTPDRVKITNGVIQYTGASTSITGLQITNSAKNFVLDNLLIQNFSTTSSTCLVTDNTESLLTIGTRLASCYNGLLVTNQSTDLNFISLQINPGGAGVPIRIEKGALGINFDNLLVQNSSNIHAVEIDSSSTGVINGVHLKNSWLEGNGDTTANSRAFYLNATTNTISFFTVENTTINGGTGGALGTVYEFAGNVGITYVALRVNSIGGYSNTITGTQAFPVFQDGGGIAGTGFCDVCVNLSGLPGVYWQPQAGAHKYKAWAGDSAQSGDNNNWSLTDITTGFKPLHYISSSQIMETRIGIRTTPVAIAALPSCGVGTEGATAAVNDALSPVAFAAVVAGGSAHVGVYCNGTNWIVSGGSLPATVVQTNQANTYTTGLQDFSAATAKLPSAVTVGSNAITFPGVASTLATLGANALSGDQANTIAALGTATLPAYELINATPAASGAQQYSPSVHWSGQGWKTAATAASQTVDVRAYVVPLQGTTSAGAQWNLDLSSNGGAYVNYMNITNSGILAGVAFPLGATIGANNGLNFGTNNWAQLYGNSGGLFISSTGVSIQSGNVTIGTQTNGAKLDVNGLGTSATPTIRAYDQTATTGVTQLVCQDGAGQSTTACLQVKNVGGTASFSVTGAGAVTANGTISGGALTSTNITTPVNGFYHCTHGSNASCGVSTLASGTVTVSTTAIGALSAAGGSGYVVNLVGQTCSTCGHLSVGTVVAGTSFGINSTNGSDASNVYWEIRYVN